MKLHDVLYFIEEKLVLNTAYNPIYKNPTSQELFQASNSNGVRFLLYNPTKTLYITNSNTPHWEMIQILNLPLKPYRKPDSYDVTHALDPNYFGGHAEPTLSGRLRITETDSFELNGYESIQQKLKHTWSWADKYFTHPVISYIKEKAADKKYKEIGNKHYLKKI
jgi:hypothetical protein